MCSIARNFSGANFFVKFWIPNDVTVDLSNFSWLNTYYALLDFNVITNFIQINQLLHHVVSKI